MIEGQNLQDIDMVLRTLITASRSLRLYPPASPMRRQSVDAVSTALGNVFAQGTEELELALGREGFECDGEPVAVGMPGGAELVADLRLHGVKTLVMSASTTTDDLLKFLLLLEEPPEDVRASGGFGDHLAADGVAAITVSEIVLTAMDAPTAEGIVGNGLGNALAGASLEEIAANPELLGQWLAEASQGDSSGLQSSLLSLVEAVGPLGSSDLADSLSVAFERQSTPTRDALLGLAMEQGPFRNLMGEMFARQPASQIAATVLGGAFGRNMLSLSSALTSLPLDRVDSHVRDEVRAMLPAQGHAPATTALLDHLLDVRTRVEPEPSLAASDQTYLAVAQASAIRPDDLERGRRAVEASGAAIDPAGVRTLFTLLDQQTEPARIHTSAENLVRMVTRLLAAGQLPLAEYVMLELDARGERVSARPLFPKAATPAALGGLIDAVIADPETTQLAERIMGCFDDSAIAPFVEQAVSRKAEGLALAEHFFERRMIEPLNNALLSAEWYQLAPAVERLAQDGDSRAGATIEALMRRPEPRARKEIVTGLAAAGGPLAQQLLGRLVEDADPEVVVVAARALAKSGGLGTAAPIATRLSQLDMDNNDFELARELIAALARTPDPIAGEVLSKIASRRALLKRGHFQDIQSAVNAALQMRAREVARR